MFFKSLLYCKGSWAARMRVLNDGVNVFNMFNFFNIHKITHDEKFEHGRGHARAGNIFMPAILLE